MHLLFPETLNIEKNDLGGKVVIGNNFKKNSLREIETKIIVSKSGIALNILTWREYAKKNFYLYFVGYKRNIFQIFAT